MKILFALLLVPAIACATTRKDAADAVARNAPECTAIQPFYYEIGDVTGALDTGTVGGTTPVQSTQMSIASASKWLYGAYVLQKVTVLSAKDIRFLTLRSGYHSLNESLCSNATTVNDCKTACLGMTCNDAYTPADVDVFWYDSAHFQVHAAGTPVASSKYPTVRLGADTDPMLRTEIESQLGHTFRYTQPLLAGGVLTTPANYAGFLRDILSRRLAMRGELGAHPVCTNPGTCATAKNTPVPETESWHYSLGHWVEDDPLVGDGAFSSAGSRGFYPWIDASKTWYGIVARDVPATSRQEGYVSAKCGRLIRKAWMNP